MIVGCLGDICFAVFDSHVETIKNMVQNVSARYTTHQRAGGPALTEFTGTDAQTITFDIELAAYLGVNPTKERISIHALREEGDSKNRDKISIFL